jgi:hypothetical protein
MMFLLFSGNGVITVWDAYVGHRWFWGGDMSKWIPVAKPIAELENVAPTADNIGATLPGSEIHGRLTEDGSGIRTPEGDEIHYFRTKFGVRFARVVEPTGFVLWLEEVK